MFIQVRLLKGFSQPLLYKIPSTWHEKSFVGKLVRVPMRHNLYSAIVIRQFDHKPPNNNFLIREAHSIEQFPDDPHYCHFIEQLSSYYQVDSIHFIKRIGQFLNQKQGRGKRENKIEFNKDTVEKIRLTEEQQKVVNFLTPRIEQAVYTPTILHGVTGSGKTEVYKRLITQTIKAKKSVILLLPEVTLALQFKKLLGSKLAADIPIFGFHSACESATKKKLWQYLVNKKAMVIIGVHMPILLPLPNVGFIIVDEEHEVGYQEKKHPKVNSKEAAIWRARIHDIPILLGSATPSLASLYNVKTRGWKFFQLKKRFAGNFPTIQTVFLTDKKQKSRNFWISKKLENAIACRLKKKEQIIIFLNRRGYSFFVQCTVCSFIFKCHNCSVSLTLHTDNQLACHYCGVKKRLSASCPMCKADNTSFLKKGIGTQQVVAILKKLFPNATISRADMDMTTKKKAWQETLQAFEKGKLDILVGTQTITKGFHFPGVTLVGILWADLNLHFPIYNASETTLQQIIQVAGRAGRQREQSTVIVQAMMNHRIFAFLHEIDYTKFYAQEIEVRKMVDYPPYTRLVEIELKHTRECLLEQESATLIHHLFTIRTNKKLDVVLLGPSKPPISRIKKIYVRKIYIKSTNIRDAITLFKSIKLSSYHSQIFFTPNPTS